MKIPTAFPCEIQLTDQDVYVSEGMSLRDYFAAKAMPQAFKEVEEAESYNINDVAAIAYQYADAMMEARE
jgi:hypothetical protein